MTRYSSICSLIARVGSTIRLWHNWDTYPRGQWSTSSVFCCAPRSGAAALFIADDGRRIFATEQTHISNFFTYRPN